MDATSVRKALKSRNISTSTPGKKGDARMKELRQRLEEADQQLNTARSTTSINSSYSNYSESSTSSRRPPRSKMDATSVRKALKSRNISTSTPGKKGNERKELLEERLAMNSNSNSFQEQEEETEQAPLYSSRNNTNGSCSARSESTPSERIKINTSCTYHNGIFIILLFLYLSYFKRIITLTSNFVCG